MISNQPIIPVDADSIGSGPPRIGDEFWAETLQNDSVARVAERFVTELKRRLQPISSHPDLGCVAQSSGRLRCQSFFWDQDQPENSSHSRGKPVFFSPSLKCIAINYPLLRQLVLDKYFDSSHSEGVNPATLEDYLANRFEFALHEYGHVASFHRAIKPLPERVSTLRAAREAVFTQLQQVPANLRRDDGIRIVPQILSDLRAEVLRYSIGFPPHVVRDPGSFIRAGIADRVMEGGVIRSPGCTLFGLLRMAAWVGVSRIASDEPSATLVMDEIRTTCRQARLSILERPVEAAADFFGLYGTSHSFDPTVFRKSIYQS